MARYSGKKFIGIEFGVYTGEKMAVVRVPKSKYDHFSYDPDKKTFGCFDIFGKIVYAVPSEFCVYVKNMEEGAW